jgi:hypothetical protein
MLRDVIKTRRASTKRRKKTRKRILREDPAGGGPFPDPAPGAFPPGAFPSGAGDSDPAISLGVSFEETGIFFAFMVLF